MGQHVSVQPGELRRRADCGVSGGGALRRCHAFPAGEVRIDSALAIDQPSLIASGGDRVIDKLARIRVKYAPLVQTDVMTGPLAQQLGTTPANLRSSLRATTPVENLLILVTARTGSRSDSQKYASKAAEYLAKYARGRAGAQFDPSRPAFRAGRRRPGSARNKDRTELTTGDRRHRGRGIDRLGAGVCRAAVGAAAGAPP